MSDLSASKIQKIVDLLENSYPSTPPTAKPAGVQVQHGGTVFHIHPGATIGPITTIHLYPDAQKGTHGN